MADYYSILNKTIDRLSANDENHRNAVYDKARTAIEIQLRKMDPPPGEDAIAAQLSLLESAIGKIEGEQLAAQEAEASQAEVTAPAAVQENPAVTQPAVTPPQEPMQAAPVEAAAPLNQQPEPTQEQVAVEPDPVIQPEPVAAIPPETASVSEPPAAPAEPPKVDTISPPVSPASEAAKPLRKSGLIGKLLIAAAIVVLLAGGGYALWLNKDDLGSALSGLTGSDNSTTSTQENAGTENQDGESQQQEGGIKDLIDQNQDAEESVEPTAEEEPAKEPVRLGQEGQDEPAAPVTDESGEAVTEVPIVLGENAEQQSSGEDSGEAVQEVQPVEEQATPAPLPLGEVAYLYEEGAAGSGATRTNASIAWSIKRESPEAGFAPEPVIYGQMEVPEKDLSLTLSIKRNVDQALSASHMIELLFSIPENFEGGEIENIARFVLKPSEEARGEPLVAVPIKVSEGYFLIALDNLEQAVNVNSKLLVESNWIDIPVSYSVGKRALVTLEKGGTGEQVFKEAFDEWKNL